MKINHPAIVEKFIKDNFKPTEEFTQRILRIEMTWEVSKSYTETVNQLDTVIKTLVDNGLIVVTEDNKNPDEIFYKLAVK